MSTSFNLFTKSVGTRFLLGAIASIVGYASAPFAGASTSTWNAATGNWSTTTNWTPNGTPNSAGTIIQETANQNATTTVDGSGYTVGQINFNNGGGQSLKTWTFTPAASQILTLDNTGGTTNGFGDSSAAIAVTGQVGDLTVNTGIQIANTNLDIGFLASQSVSEYYNITIGGNITASTNQSLNFYGNNTSTVAGTTPVIVVNGTIGASGSNIAINNLGTGKNDTVTLAGSLGTSVTSVTENSTTTMTLSGANTSTGSVTVTAGTLTLSNTNAFNSYLVNGSAAVLAATGTTTNTLGSAAGGITLTNAGTLNLNNSGLTTYSTGPININGVATIGVNVAATTTGVSSVLNFGAGSTLNVTSLTTAAGTANFQTGAENMLGNVTINADELTGQVVSITSPTDNTGGSTTGFSLTKGGAGLLLDTSTNYYYGATNIVDGELRLYDPTASNSTSIAIGGAGVLGITNASSAPSALITNTSSGTLALATGGNYTPALNLANIGNGSMFLGSSVSSTYNASTLGVGATDGTMAAYRLGGGGAILTIGKANVLTGASDVIINGNVTFTLGQNYTGSTTINSGTLTITTVGSTSAYTINNGAALALSANIDPTTAMSGGTSTGYILASGITNTQNFNENNAGTGVFIGASSAGATISGGTWTAASDNTFRIGGGAGTLTFGANALTGTKNVIISGPSATTFNVSQGYTGSTTLQAGSYTVTVGSTSGGANTTLSASSGVTANPGNTIVITNGGTNNIGPTASGVTTDFSALTLNTSSLTATGVSGYNTVNQITNALTLNSGGNTITVTPNSTRNAQLSAGSLVESNGATVNFAGASLGVNTIASATINNANISFGNSSTIISSLIGGGGTTATNLSILPYATANNNNLVTYTAANGVIALTGTNYQTFASATTTDNVNITAATAVASPTTVNSIMITGGGTTALSGSALTLSSGVLYNEAGTNTVANNISLPVQGFFIANGQLNLSGAISGSSGLVKAGGGILQLLGANSYTGGTIVNGGQIYVGATDGSVGGSNGVFGLVPNSVSASNIVFAGSGFLVDAMNNSATLNSNRGIVVNNGVILTVDTGGSSLMTFTVNGPISGSGALVAQNGNNKIGTVVLGGASSYTGGTTVKNTLTLSVSADNNLGNDSGALTFAPTSGSLFTPTFLTTGSFSSTRNIVMNTQNVNFNITGGTVTENGVISGVGDLVKSGASTLVLGGLNIYTGETTVQAGSIQTGANNALPNGTQVNLAAGTGLNLGGFSSTIGGLVMFGGNSVATGAGTLKLEGNLQATSSGATAATISGNLGLGSNNLDATATSGFLVTSGGGGATTDLTVSANISGGVGITKYGNGILALTGSNTYGGPTVVNAGTVYANNTSGSATGSGPVTVGGAEATGSPILMGTGLIGGNVLVSSASGGVAGKISPGTAASPNGTLTVGGSIEFQLGSTFAINMSGSNTGELVIGGTATIDGGADITINIGTALSGSSYTLATAAGGGLNSADPFTVLGSLPTGYQLVYTGTALDLTQISGTTYTLTTAAASSVLHTGQATAVTATIANTGSSSLTYSGLGTTAGTGSVNGTAGTGTIAASGSPGTNGQTYTAPVTTTTGTDTITAVASSSNGTLSGNAGTETITVYTGQGTWIGTAGGTWGTPTASPANWQALGGVPGLAGGSFINTDSAKFGNTTSSAQSVTLDGQSPSLNNITFNTAGSYNIAPGTGGTVKLNGSPTATITNTAGSNTISAPVELDSNAAASVAVSTDVLTISGAVSESGGSHSFSVSGPGKTLLSSPTGNTYSGGTTVSSAGQLYVKNNTSGSATGTGAVAVSGTGSVLAGTGTISGAVTVGSGASLYSGGVVTGTPAITPATGSLALSSSLGVSSANLTFALQSGGDTLNGGTAGTGSYNFANPITDTTYMNVTGNTTGEISFTGSDTVSLVDLSASGTTPGSLTFNLHTPYLLIKAGSSSDYSGLVTVTGTGASAVYQLDGSGWVVGDLNAAGILAYGNDASGTVLNGFSSTDVNTIAITEENSAGQPLTGTQIYPAPVLYLNNGDLEVVPEPGTWAMMLGGLAVLLIQVRRRRSD